MLANFAGGIDLRPGLYSKDQNLFQDLLNLYVTPGRKLRRRWPLIKRSGQIDAQCQGLLLINGTWYTFAPKGTVVNHTVTPETPTTLFFDVPDYCAGQAWQFIAADQIGTTVIAYIRHDFPGTVVTSRLFLHVWDALTGKPTYVEDPACPTSWGPAFPQHVWGAAPTGTVGAFQDYTPRLKVGVSKAFATRPDGLTACSRVGLPRYWNARKPDDILNNGEWYYFITPTGQGNLLKFIVSDSWADLAADGKWAAYVLEYLDGTGTWQKFVEDGGPPTVNGHYYPASVASRFAGQPNEIQLQVYWTGAVDTILRFRLIARPTVTVVSGLDTATTKSATVVSTGATSYLISAINPVEKTLYAVTINGVPKALGAQYTWAVIGGVTEIVFPSAGPITAGVAQTVFDFPTMNAGCLDEISVGVFLNGIQATSGFTLAPDGTGGIQVTFGTSPATGTKVSVKYAPPTGAVILCTYQDVLIGYGVVSLENQTFTYNGREVAHLTQNQNYLCGINLAGIAAGGIAADYFIQTPDQVQFPLNGYQRYYSLMRVRCLTPDGTTLNPSSTYLYASQQNGGLGSTWFVAKQVNDTANLAGNADASVFNTSAQNTAFAGDQGLPTALAFILSRMLVMFKSTTQMWQADPDPTQMAFIATHPFGTGVNSHPVPVQFYENVIIPTQSGVRGINLYGLQFNNLQDDFVGEPISGLTVPDLTYACFWANQGQYVTAGIQNGQLELLVLTYSKVGQISSWSRWTCAGVTRIDGLIPLQGSLYVVSGQNLYLFDTTATVFRDSNDPVPRWSNDPSAPAYLSQALWHFNDFQKPGLLKKYLNLDLVATGLSTIQFQFVPYDSSQISISLPIQDITAGKQRVPLLMTGQAIAPQILSTDDTGFQLEGMELDFAFKER